MSSFLQSLYSKYGEDFFREEVRCEFTVTREHKELWAVLLDIFEQFNAVCERHNLRYFLIGGSLLGAVRHKGFIPWDDDFDVAMPREDYEKFILLASDIEQPYFLQTPYSDKKCCFSFAKLRNTETTALHTSFIEKEDNMHMGAFLDIFQLDKTPREKLQKIRTEIFPAIMSSSAFMRKNAAVSTERDQKIIQEYYPRNCSNIDCYETIQQIARQYESDPGCDMFSMNACTIYHENKQAFPIACFEHTVLLPFEHLSVRCPQDYDTVLKIMYGNYMEFPPVEKRGQWHQTVRFDMRHSYKISIDKWLNK